MAQHPIESRFRPVDPILQGIVSGIANDPGKFMTSRILPGIDVGGGVVRHHHDSGEQ